ncbi:MAG: hypothetical protein ACD_73C00146G0002 [uncultured bacterium]|nr:MAG: hypothetical protein ACD_73C00146G0002 [uncultured bacterium]
MQCPFCSKELTLDPKISFRESCFYCVRDLHCCFACHFYDTSAANECREPQADPVIDKEKANYCEYFQFANKGFSGQKEDPAIAAKRKLEELFKKK